MQSMGVNMNTNTNMNMNMNMNMTMSRSMAPSVATVDDLMGIPRQSSSATHQASQQYADANMGESLISFGPSYEETPAQSWHFGDVSQLEHMSSAPSEVDSGLFARAPDPLPALGESSVRQDHGSPGPAESSSATRIPIEAPKPVPAPASAPPRPRGPLLKVQPGDQARMDEIKAFNASLTKAKGYQASPPSSTPVVPVVTPPVTAPRPAPKQPATTKVPVEKPLVEGSWGPNPPSQEIMDCLAAMFLQRNGRPHTKVNDIWQPASACFWATKLLPQLLASSAAVPASRAKTMVKTGDVLISQGSKEVFGGLALAKGDHVEILSILNNGKSLLGLNKRTLKRGETHARYFEQNKVLVRSSSASAPNNTYVTTPMNSVIARMDSIERRNARDWEGDDEDDDDVTNEPNANASTAASTSSKFALPPSLQTSGQNGPQQLPPLTTENVSVATTRMAKNRKNAQREEPFEAVIPKTETCW